MADVDGGEVVDNPAASRFELTIDGQTAELVYRLKPPVLELVHTGVPDALEGEGVGGRLVRGRASRSPSGTGSPSSRPARSPAAGCAGIPRRPPG